MVSGYLIGCGCMNLWNTDGLTLIFDICMNCHFLFLCIQSFESYQWLSSQCRRIKGKGNVDASIFGFCGKGFTCGYFLSVYKDRLACLLIHQFTGYGILSSDFKTLVGNSVYDNSLIFSLLDMILCILSYCCGMNLRDINGLVFVVDIFMYGNLDSLVLKILKGYNGLWCKNWSIKGKDYVNTSLFIFSSEGCACSDFLTIN